MTQSKHTPGPWTVPHFVKPDVNCECGYVLTDGYMGAICTVHVSGEGDDWQAHGDNPRFAEACANARLIAAAPALLEALEGAVDVLELVAGRVDGAAPALREARAAIAAASGSDR